MAITSCPSTADLKAYLTGQLDEPITDMLTEHLQQCEVCENTVVRLEQEPDTLVNLLRSSNQVANNDSSAVPDNQLRNQAGSSEIDPFLLDIPRLLGQYELISVLGRGGMGAVYLARHRSLDKQVAIKLLPALPAENHEFVSRFQREMRAAGRLDHPSIVRTTDAGEQHGVHFLVMDAIDGANLSHIARCETKLRIADACELIRQTALGLAHAHEKGIVHRDIKPSNVMLDRTGKVRILDFGLAQIGFWESGSAEITTVGQLMGTLDYMAPEQAERGGAVDYRADLYSLGATLFRLITGRPPLAPAPNLTPLEKLRLLATHKAPKLQSLRPDAPKELSDIVDAMLARDPALRPASATHAAELLEPFCTETDLVGLLERSHNQPTHEETDWSVQPLLRRDLTPLAKHANE